MRFSLCYHNYMRIKQVKWRDSRVYLEQCPIDSDFEICEIKSVGYVIEESDKHIVLAREVLEDDARGLIVIPKEKPRRKAVC